jgi:RNA polymerase sigma-70 factor (ECF subfamily)
VDHRRSDSEIICASLTSPEEFAAIFDRHVEAIHAYLQRRLGRELADEIGSQTFLVAFDRRAGYDLGYPLARPWLFGIATNLLRRHHRDEVRRLRAYARSGVDPVLDPFEGLEERLDASALRRELVESLAGLSREELDVLLLCAWTDLSYPQIGEALGIPTGTVRSRLHRVRRRMRELLGGAEASSGWMPGGEDGGL